MLGTNCRHTKKCGYQSWVGTYIGCKPKNHMYIHSLNNFLNLSEVPIINSIYLGKKHGPLMGSNAIYSVNTHQGIQ